MMQYWFIYYLLYPVGCQGYGGQLKKFFAASKKKNRVIHYPKIKLILHRQFSNNLI